MHLDEFNYELPDDLIAQRPTDERTASRLLLVDCHSEQLSHARFPALLDQLRDTDLLVFNDTRVIPARLWAHKETGGRVEILIERLLSDSRALVQMRASHSPKAGVRIDLGDGDSVVVEGRQDGFFILQTSNEVGWADLLVRHGHMPLPPYIERDDDDLDLERYQTVYAQTPGAVAAPTAGLHFDDAMLEKIRARGIEIGTVTLHVGAGTFQPVRCDTIEEHQIHHEWLQVSQALCDQVAAAKARGGRVVAIGTTSVRALESAAQAIGVVQAFEGDTNLFIYPGYRFQVVDAMLTNFHLPKSSLLMLVGAFAGMDTMREAYRQAVEHKYRFFSYGDAMFIGSSAENLQHEI